MDSSLTCPRDVHYLLVFDGGSKGNPGHGYGSYALFRCDTGQCKIRRLQFGAQVTNNEAEYRTLIEALRALLATIRGHGKLPDKYRLEVRGDSQLVIKQLSGAWKARDPRMRALRDEALSLLQQFGAYRLVHQDRHQSVQVLGH